MAKPQLELTGIDNDSCTRLNSGSTMQDGVVTIPKRLYFKVPNGQNPRQYSDLDVYGHPLFPQRYSALAADPRYKFYGNATVRHDLDDGHYFTAELEYSTRDPNASDDDGGAVTSETKPWKLKPDNIEFTYPEMNVKFEASYNSTGKLYTATGTGPNGNTIYQPVLPVANSAGDPFLLERTVRNLQMSFTFAAQSWNISHAINYGNTINANEITVVGLTIPAGRALLLPPECSYITVYKDNSSTVKWRYWSIKIVIQVDMTGLLLLRKVLNVGDRAKFPALNYSDALVSTAMTLPASQGAAQICRFRKYIRTNLTGGKYNFTQIGDNVFCSWNQFIAFRQAAISRSAGLASLTGPAKDPNYTGGIVDPHCEQLTKMPLIATGANRGQLDTAAITSGNYASLSFREYPYKNWSSLNLPKKGIKW